jgi:anti-sigma B factor antagonist
MEAPVAAPPDTLLRVSTTRGGATVTVRLDGELDCSTAPRLLRDFQTLFATTPPDRLVIDAEGLRFIDAAGLDPLLWAARRLREPGAFQLRNARRTVTRVVRLLDLGEVLGLDG